MAFSDGDFLEVEYSAYNSVDNALIDTTDEKIAKDKNAHVEGRKYGPFLVVLGSTGIVKGLDKALREMRPNETRKLTLKPVDAFGERNPDIVKVMPLAEFKKRDINPYPGMRVNIDNVSATVKSVNSGRVVVDANHPYAGFDIIYDVKLIRQLTDQKEKIMALGKTYDVEPSSASVDGDVAKLEFADSVKKDADYFVGRASLVAAIFSYFKGIQKVKIDEEYARPKEEDKKKDGEDEAEHSHDHEMM